MTDTARQRDLNRFYGLLHDLKQRVGGMRKLKNCTGYIDWPDRGVYFFPEPGETRLSDQMRVTHVGTHAVSEGSSTSLWDRLKSTTARHGQGSSNHPHGGAHRGSVYRKCVDEAIIEEYGLHEDYPDWDKRWSSIERERSEVRDEEYILERRVN